MTAREILKQMGVTVVLAIVAMASTTGMAAASAGRAHWAMIVQPAPTYFHLGDESDFYEILAINDGGAPTSGETVVTDILPSSVTATGVVARATEVGDPVGPEGGYPSCTVPAGPGGAVVCNITGPVMAGGMVEIKISVSVSDAASGPLVDSVAFSGGEAEEASYTATTPLVAAGAAVPFGATISSDVTTSGGTAEQQAGAHPNAFTTLIGFNVGSVAPHEQAECKETHNCAVATSEAKDIEVALPPGLLGDVAAVPQCSQADFNAGACPEDTQVGEMFAFFFRGGNNRQYSPVYNVVPPPGEPAELGFSVGIEARIPVYFHVRSDGDYGLTAEVSKLTEQDAVRATVLSIWGVPSASVHDELLACVGKSPCEQRVRPAPFLTMPTACLHETLPIVVTGDSWQQPSVSSFATLASSEIAGVTGCEALLVQPELGLKSTNSRPGEPAGYDVALTVPQNEEVEALATPALRDIEVTLPLGTTVSPSAATGLVACSEAQFAKYSGRRGKCPSEARVGKVTITSPLLAAPIEGSVFVGEPECSPCTPQDAAEGKMVRLLIEAGMPGPESEAGRPAVLVKVTGHTEIDQATGRLTTLVEDAPDLPFSEMRLTLDAGADAPLANPTNCAPAAASGMLTAWSALVGPEGEVLRDAEGHVMDAGSEAEVKSNAIAMKGCTTSPFVPSMSAGMTTSHDAGAYSEFVVNLTRADGEPTLGKVAIKTPSGVAGIIAGVPVCPEADANAGTCSAASQIGTSTATVGPGSAPYTVSGGRVFLTGPYAGAPFGLSIVMPAKAGPFTLAGNAGEGSEVVRAAIAVDPHTAALTITTNPLPTELDGVPLDIQNVRVDVNREAFMFNPTNCDAMSISGEVNSTDGASVEVNTPFQVANCANLTFKPALQMLVHANHSRKHGVYAHFVVKSGSGQANIGSVFVKLPRILPSRESTLKQACAEEQFTKDPAGCPEGSKVGMATAYTPVLPVPLTGPAIFVSHGGEAYPDLDLVLQGDNVTVILTGNTHIDGKTGVTSSDFKTVPDVPITRFDLVLPAQRNSALGANGDLCYRTVVKSKHMRVRRHGKWVKITKTIRHKVRRRIVMPTTITGHNGAVVKRQTKVAVMGCGKAKGVRHHGKHQTGRKH